MKQLDGYLLIDNRCSGGGVTEMKTRTCNHCHAIVQMNPMRIRERGYCRGCESYLCDACAAIRAQTGECRTMSRVIDEALTRAEKSATSLILRV
jgi:hypothetical protein